MTNSLLKGAAGRGPLSKAALGKGDLGKGVLASNFPTAKTLMPSGKFEQPWVKQLKFINSDIYKLSGMGQGNLTAFNLVLAKNADFGFNKTAAKWASQFATQQNSWLKTIGPKLATLKLKIYPANLQEIEGLRLVEVEEVVMLDGIALYAVPRTEIAEKLVRADSTSARREILGRRWKAIAVDCRTALAGCTSASMANYVSFTVDALDALDGGHSRAAQALAASVLDTVVNGHFGNERFKLTPNKKTITPAEYDEFTVCKFIALAPLWQAYQKFRVEDGDPIPHTFSRHASVHGVSSRQFSRRNAVQALLFVSSLLLFLDEEAVAADIAASGVA